MILPIGQTILARAAGPQRIGRVMSVVGIPMLLGPVLGPAVGGLIIDSLSWRWIFLRQHPDRDRRARPRCPHPESGRHGYRGQARCARSLAALTGARRHRLRPVGGRQHGRLLLTARTDRAGARRGPHGGVRQARVARQGSAGRSAPVQEPRLQCGRHHQLRAGRDGVRRHVSAAAVLPGGARAERPVGWSADGSAGSRRHDRDADCGTDYRPGGCLPDRARRRGRPDHRHPSRIRRSASTAPRCCSRWLCSSEVSGSAFR